MVAIRQAMIYMLVIIAQSCNLYWILLTNFPLHFKRTHISCLWKELYQR